jgi:hypothetical protein
VLNIAQVGGPDKAVHHKGDHPAKPSRQRHVFRKEPALRVPVAWRVAAFGQNSGR